MIRFGNALSLALCTTWIALWNSVGMADSLDEKDPPEMQRMRDTLSNTMTGGGTAEDYVKRADECIAAVDAAIKAGLSPTKEFTFFGGDPSEPPPAGMRWSKNGQLITTAPTAKKAICMAAMATGLAGPLSQTLSQSVQELSYYAENSTPPADGKAGLDAIERAKLCSKQVTELLGKNVPASAPVSFSLSDHVDIKSPMPLGEIDSKICKRLAAASDAYHKAAVAKELAFYGPYLKVLTGYKKQYFIDQRYFRGVDVKGHHGVDLEKPQDFARSNIWCKSYETNDTWEVSCRKFNGDKDNGVYNNSGRGPSAPSSAYP